MSTLAEDKSNVATAVDHSGRPTYDDVNVPFVVVLGVVSAIITYVSIVGVQGLYYHWEDAQIREKEYGATVAAARTIDDQKELLDDFHQAKTGDAKSIPIDLAMSLTLKEFANADHGDKQGDKHGDAHANGGHDSEQEDDSLSKSKDAKAADETPDEKKRDADNGKKADAENKQPEPKADDAKKSDDARRNDAKKSEAKPGESRVESKE